MPPEPAAELAQIQSLLGEAFRQPAPLAATEALEAVVQPNARLSAVARAEIYRDQFWARHLGSLREDLPGLAHFLGDEAFDAFLRAYLVACPPRSFTLRDLGDRLVAFADVYAFAPERAEAARELVRFEMACLEAFDAADVSPLAAFTAQDLASARLSFLRTLSVATYAHPVNVWRAAVKRGETPEELPRERTHVALWRCPRMGEVKHRRLAEGEHRLLARLMAGATVGEACLGAEADDVQRWFAGFARRGFIVAIAPTT